MSENIKVRHMFMSNSCLIRVIEFDSVLEPLIKYKNPDSLYRAQRTTNFIDFDELDGSLDNKLRDVVAYVKRNYPNATELSSLDDVVLYCQNVTKDVWQVSLKNRGAYRFPVIASNVPVGSYLSESARAFFSFYKGEDAVDGDTLVK